MSVSGIGAAEREQRMEISNSQSWYVNPNTRQVTSNVKNTIIKDREAFNGSMQNLLNPVEDLEQVLKTPIKLADRSSLNRQSNSINIASGMRIAVNDGYTLKVKPQGVEVSGGDNPYDTEAYIKAQKMADSLVTGQENPWMMRTAAPHRGRRLWKPYPLRKMGRFLLTGIWN